MEYFTILNENTHRFPLVIDLPHSGTLVPPHIRSRMLDTACLSNSDWFLPELYDFLPAMGCTTIVNHLSRYVVDVNRPTGGAKDGDYRNTVVYQQNTQGSPLYAIPLEEKEINERITQYYQPYHQALENLLRAKLQVFPSVLLLDLHSFLSILQMVAIRIFIYRTGAAQHPRNRRCKLCTMDLKHRAIPFWTMPF